MNAAAKRAVKIAGPAEHEADGRHEVEVAQRQAAAHDEGQDSEEADRGRRHR